MFRFLRARLYRALLVLLVGSLFAYMLLRLLPGDPTLVKLGANGTQEARDALLRQWKLDGPWYSGYVRWLGGAIHGDLGKSFANNTPITTRLRQTLIPSFQLMIYAQVVALTVAVMLGVLQAYLRGTRFDKVMNGVTSVLISAPPFVLGLWLQIWVARKGGFFKATGYVPFSEDLWQHFKLMILPAVTLAAGPLATYARLLRTDMIATLQEDYILMAKSKGLRPSYLLFRHGLKPSLFSLITSAGLNIGALIGGAVAVESTFAIPGLGRLIVGSILEREYLQVQAGFLAVVLIFVVSNLAVELLYGVLDPRIRHARSIG